MFANSGKTLRIKKHFKILHEFMHEFINVEALQRLQVGAQQQLCGHDPDDVLLQHRLRSRDQGVGRRGRRTGWDRSGSCRRPTRSAGGDLGGSGQSGGRTAAAVPVAPAAAGRRRDSSMSEEAR